MSDDFIEFVSDQLGALEGFRSKRMFGGHGLYLGDRFFGIVADRQLFFKTNDDTRTRYVTAGMSFFQPNPKQALKHYFEVPAGVIEQPVALQDWALQAAATHE